jgi:hypothetical protein
VVDWVGFNQYNWWRCNAKQWSSARELLSSPMDWLNSHTGIISLNKPVMIGGENTGAANSEETKGNWYRSVPSTVSTFFPVSKP